MHQSDLRCSVDYNPFDRLSKNEKDLINLDFTHPEKYLELRRFFNTFKEYLENLPKVLCHNDSQPSNFVSTNDNLFVVDFEFIGNNDLVYDIACFANMDIKDGEKLLDVYFDGISYEEMEVMKKRFYLWRAFQCFQWFNVAMFKDLVGMSETLKLDFKMIALSYLKQIEENLNKVKKLEK